MAFLDQAIDLGSLPQSEQSYDLLPPGWYSASITKAELKATKDGTGQYIAIRYDITGRVYKSDGTTSSSIHLRIIK